MKTPEDEAFEEIERIQRTRTKWVSVKKPQDEIIEMAIKAELNLYVHDLTEKQYIQVIETFAKLVAAKEREACAKLCDELVSDENTIEYANAAYRCSVRIRERREA
jgi:hypothetical protein